MKESNDPKFSASNGRPNRVVLIACITAAAFAFGVGLKANETVASIVFLFLAGGVCICIWRL